VTGIPEKALFPSVTVYSKNLSSQCNLPAQIEQVQDKNKYEAWSVVKIIILIHASDKGSNYEIHWTFSLKYKKGRKHNLNIFKYIWSYF